MKGHFVRSSQQNGSKADSINFGSGPAAHVRFFVVACFAVASSALAGCAVGPDFKPQAVPDTSRYLSDRAGDRVPGHPIVHTAEIPPQWWELFRSPALNRIVADGIAHNTDLAAAEAAVRVAQANALAQRGALFPSVTGNFNSSRQQVAVDLSSPLESGANIFNLHTGQVTVSYVADVWGGTRRQVESMDAQAKMRAFQREGVYLTLASNIALAAIEEGRLRGQISATRRVIDLQSEVLRLLKRQQEQGQIALTDVAAQETAVAQTRLLLPPLEKQLAQQRHLLSFLTGRVSSDAPGETFNLGSFRMPRRLPLSLPADLVRQRPDIQAAEANFHASNAMIGVAIANRLPQITLTGNVGAAAASFAQLAAPGAGLWMIAGNAAQTIFDAGALENKQRAAEAEADQSLALYRSTVLAAFQNVADVLRALQAGTRAIRAATDAERSASQSITLLRKQVDQGQISVPLLLAAQQAYLQTSLARLDAQAAQLANTVALFQALGGGWWNRDDPQHAGPSF
ncbi:MAG: efflux transporter outer membrane subunit [Rhizobiales bacterium]|nr:efflux transporter outer membrane subunit [Hyphomicrobiales bacterium]